MQCFWCNVELEQCDGGNVGVYWRCPECGGTWWPGRPHKESDAEILWNSEQAYKKMLAKRSGSRSSGRKRAKKPPKIQRDYWRET